MFSVLFYTFATLLIVSAILVVSVRNAVYSVFCLILAFIQAAGLFILLGAEFLAMILLIVYIGAVAVLFVFVVMMLDVDWLRLRQRAVHYGRVGLMIGLILLAELVLILGAWTPGPQDYITLPISPDVTNTESIGRVLYTDYLYIFQSAGILLLIAMIGAIVLTLRARPGVRKQKISQQIAQTKASVLSIRAIPSRKGIK